MQDECALESREGRRRRDEKDKVREERESEGTEQEEETGMEIGSRWQEEGEEGGREEGNSETWTGSYHSSCACGRRRQLRQREREGVGDFSCDQVPT